MEDLIKLHDFNSEGQLMIVDDELLDKFKGNHTIKTVYSNFGFIPYSDKERWYNVYYNQSNRQGCNREGLMWNKTYTREVQKNYDIAVMVETGGCSSVQKTRNIELAGGNLAIIVDKKYEKLSNSKVLEDDGSGQGIRIPAVLIGNEHGKRLRDYYMKQNPESIHKGHIIELFTDNFNTTVIDSEDAWLIEFYNPSCSHCIAFGPTYNRVATDFKGRVMVARINVVAEPDLVSRFSVTEYPTIMAFKYGLESKTDDQILEFTEPDRSEDAVVKFGQTLYSGVDEDEVENKWYDEDDHDDGRYGKDGKGKPLILNIKWTLDKSQNFVVQHVVGESNDLTDFEKVKFSIFYTSGNPQSLNLLKHMAKYQRAIFNNAKFSPKIVTYKCVDCTSSFIQQNCVSNGNYCAMTDQEHPENGRSVILEDLRQHCMNELFTWDNRNHGIGLLMDYVHRASMVCGWGQITSECSRMAHKAQEQYDEKMGYGGVGDGGVKAIETCLQKSFQTPENYIGREDQYDHSKHNYAAENSVLKAHRKEWEAFGTQIYPMATVNDVVIRGHLTAESIFVALCGQFKSMPKGCKKLLNESGMDQRLKYKNPLGPTMNKTAFYIIIIMLIGGLAAYAFKKNQDIINETNQEKQQQVQQAVSQYVAMSQYNQSQLNVNTTQV